MSYSKLLNLGEILTNAPTHVVMRRSGVFPNYKQGTNIDLLVRDMDKMIAYLSRWLPNYTRYVISATHIQIDHWAAPRVLDLKFDLYTHHISEALTDQILATKVPLIDDKSGGAFSIPQPMMDNLLKAYEYLRNGKQKCKEFAIYEPLLKPYL